MPLEKVLLFGDLHFPYHSQRAVDLLLDVAHQWKPTHLVCLGDLLDCYSISSHSKDPARRLALQDEVEQAAEFLDALPDVDGRKLFLEGNHEQRLQRYIADKAPELFGLVSLPQILQLKERGWQHTVYRRHTKLGKLYLCHDLGHAGRYAAQRTLDAIQHSVAFGHTHRLSLLVEGNVLGEPKIAASFGWLGDINQVDYTHRAKVQKDWALGFGVGYFDTQTGFVKLDPVPILELNARKLTCTVEGRRYDN